MMNCDQLYYFNASLTIMLPGYLTSICLSLQATTFQYHLRLQYSSPLCAISVLSDSAHHLRVSGCSTRSTTSAGANPLFVLLFFPILPLLFLLASSTLLILHSHSPANWQI